MSYVCVITGGGSGMGLEAANDGGSTYGKREFKKYIN